MFKDKVMGKNLALIANIVFVCEVIAALGGSVEVFEKGKILEAVIVILGGIATAFVSHIFLHTIADTNIKTAKLLTLMEQKQETASK